MTERRAPPIYLDYQATTPTDPDVVAAMAPYWTQTFGNPHSAAHRYGWEAAAAVDVARGRIADVISAKPTDVIFTSGATEANNLALKGVLEASPAHRRRLVTVVTEHACVLETAAYLAGRNFPVTVLPVDAQGLLQASALEKVMADDVALVSVMAVHNEIGVIQPLTALAAVAHAHGALFHTDAAQAFGKIALDVQTMGIDLMSLSAHKLYGPKGIGALVARAGLRLAPQMHGGGQERGLRSGTLAPALCVGFGMAAVQARARMSAEAAHVDALWQRFVAHLDRANIHYAINGAINQRWRGNLNVSFLGCDGNRLIADVKGLALSSGAACASAAGKGSYVLPALGLDAATARASLRIGFGRPTTPDDVDVAANALIAAVQAQVDKAA